MGSITPVVVQIYKKQARITLKTTQTEKEKEEESRENKKTPEHHEVALHHSLNTAD